MTLASRFRSSLGGEISSLSAELVSVRLTSAQVLVCFVCPRRYRPVLVWVASSSHFAADLAEGEGIGGSLAGSVRFSTSTHHRNRFYGATQTDNPWLCWQHRQPVQLHSVDRCQHRSAMPPQGVDPQDDSSPSHSSESLIKRRPGTKASAGRGHQQVRPPSRH